MEVLNLGFVHSIARLSSIVSNTGHLYFVPTQLVRRDFLSLTFHNAPWIETSSNTTSMHLCDCIASYYCKRYGCLQPDMCSSSIMCMQQRMNPQSSVPICMYRRVSYGRITLCTFSSASCLLNSASSSASHSGKS